MARIARATSFAGSIVGVVLATLAAAPPGPARADEPKDPSTPVTGSSCAVKGTTPPVKDTLVYDARTGGKAIAKLTGALVPVTLSDFAADPAAHRAKIQTTKSGAALRVEGFVAPSAFTFFTSKDVWITSPNLAISSAQKVSLVSASSGTLGVELKIAGSNGQAVRANAGCDAIAVEKGTPGAFQVPGNGRGWQTKSTALDLFDAPSGNAIFTLKMSEGTGQLFWSTESRAGFVHVLARGDLSIDAWARQSALEPLKKGEMVDQLATPSTQQATVQLALDKAPKLVKATRDIPIRASRDLKAPAIGVVETDAEIYVMETVAGWTNVAPKSLGVMPADDAGFWMPSSDVPKESP